MIVHNSTLKAFLVGQRACDSVSASQFEGSIVPELAGVF